MLFGNLRILSLYLHPKYNNNYQAMADEFCRRANELGDLYRNKTK